MKTLITLFAMALGFGAFAQEQVQEIKPREINLLQVEKTEQETTEQSDIFNSETRSTDSTITKEIVEIRISSNCIYRQFDGYDFPNTSLITGANYSADYIRNTVRN